MGHCLVGARLICGLVMCAEWPRCSCHVSELGEALERLLRDDGVDWDPIRYRMHCSSGLQFSCLAWKPCDGSHLPHLAWGTVGVNGCTAHVAGLLLGWAACRVVSCGGCEVFWRAPQYRVVMWARIVVLFAIPAMTFSTQYNCWELSGDG